MNAKTTLVSLFNKEKETLEKQLTGLLLPKDTEHIQKVIAEYFNTLLESESDFRQSLTQSEDYILQAALSLLSAQQEIAKAVVIENAVHKSFEFEKNNFKKPTAKPLMEFANVNIKAENALVASAGGSLIGGTILGGWGDVIGSIAGTALTIYLTQLEKQKKEKQQEMFNRSIEVGTPVDIQQLIKIVARICESVDSLVETFRAQINRVVEKYEGQEKPTFEKEHRPLLEELQSLIGYERTHDGCDEKSVRKLKERIEDIVETLENYSLKIVDYSDEVSCFFEKISSPNANELKMVYPAVVKDGNLVLFGKVFIPE